MNVGRYSGHGNVLGRENGRLVVSVLGGTSAGTPALIRAVAAAAQDSRLPAVELRLHGRAVERGRGLIEYAAAAIPGVGLEPTSLVRLRLAPDLDDALAGSEAVVCQVRSGGMAARVGDEAMALAEGVPADEGLGPSGLANYLRSRPLLDRISEVWARVAPRAVFLQLTSPLGLSAAHVARFGGRVFGLCELPATTSRAIRAVAEPTLGPLRHAHFGLNHCSWLYCFRDAVGIDRTAEVIALAAEADLLPIDAATAHRQCAIPVGYLRLFHLPEAIVAEQRARGRSRGAEVMEWCAALDAAYRRPAGPAVTEISALLARRRMNWHDEAVIPVLAAWLGTAPGELVLNVTGVAAGIAVELPCRVDAGVAAPVGQPPLPAGPDRLYALLATYEHAALALPAEPDEEAVADVLALHPLVPDADRAIRLSRSILARREEGQ